MNYDDMLKAYKATALYKGNQVDPQKHPVVYNFLRGLNDWQRNKFLVAEHDNEPRGLVLYLFMPHNQFEISIYYHDPDENPQKAYTPGFISTMEERKPRAGETWCRQQNVREGDLTVENLNTAFKVFASIEADSVQDSIWRH